MLRHYKVTLVVGPPDQFFEMIDDEARRLRVLVETFSKPDLGIHVCNVEATTQEEFDFLKDILVDDAGEII